jgi:hypothetical protein
VGSESGGTSLVIGASLLLGSAAFALRARRFPE